jgi:molecular chaperone HscB
MNTHLALDDFALFGLPRRFALDRGELDSRRRALQAEVHPDRFTGADAAARRAAMQ